MTTPAYSPIYLGKAARAVGNMLHDAVIEFGMEGADFLQQFIQSGVAEQIENGNPKYVAGKSGFELFAEVVEQTYGKAVDECPVESYDRSDVYWVGWMLTHYQWYSGHSFRDILQAVPFDELMGLYGTLHEADIHKSYEVMDAHFQQGESKLKSVRKRCKLTQEALAEASGVSLNTIRAYERKAKDINKAQADIILSLASALKCDMMDLLD